MNRIAYTGFVAFVASVLTLVAIHALVPAANSDPDADLRQITPEELAEHADEESCWKAIEGNVYDVTDYIPRHPTPDSVMLRWCGYESTPGWVDKGGSRGHSPAAEAMLREYLVGRLVGEAPLPPGVEVDREVSAPEAGEPTDPRDIAWRPEVDFPDGRYRGTFADRGYHQVAVQFYLEGGLIRDITYRHLYYAGEDYLEMDENHPLYPVMRQHRQIVDHLEGKPVERINDLYTPEHVVDDLDGFTGATLRGSKIISAMRDALNRGVY